MRGKTWTHLGLRDGQQIPALAIDPHDPNRLFAAVLGQPYGPNPERGIFRSTDGGRHWQKVLYKDENTGASDVEIDPSNPDIVYAGMWESSRRAMGGRQRVHGTNGGMFKSTDGGKRGAARRMACRRASSQIYIAIAHQRSAAALCDRCNTDLRKVRHSTVRDDGGETWAQVDGRSAARDAHWRRRSAGAARRIHRIPTSFTARAR